MLIFVGTAYCFLGLENSTENIIEELPENQKKGIRKKISSKERDDDHNLGHGKAEYIYSLLISILIIFSSILLLKNLKFN